MPDNSPDPRDPWFSEVRGPDVGGAYRPITRSGRRVARLSWIWIIGCGILFPILAVSRHEPLWFGAMFVFAALGMIVLAATVRRRS